MSRLFAYKPSLYFILSSVSLLISLFQGVGEDSFFYVNNYSHFLSNPQSSMYDMQWYLTFVLGDLIGLDTIIKARLAGMVMLMCCWLLSFFILRPYIDGGRLGFGLFLSTLGVYGAPMEIGYNHFTVLSILLVCLFVILSLKHRCFCFIAGLITSIMIFFRFPNVILECIGVVYFLYHFIDSAYNLKRATLSMLLFIIGSIFGVLLMYLIMNYLGHWDLFISAIGNSIMNAGSDSDNIHGSLSLIMKYIKTYSVPVILFLLSVSCYAFYEVRKLSLIIHSSAGKRVAKVIFLLVLTSLTFYVSKSAAVLFWTVSIPSVIIILTSRDFVPQIRLIAIFAIIMVLIAPIGSFSIMSFYGPLLFWIAIPLSIMLYGKGLKYKGIYFDNLFRCTIHISLIIVLIKNLLFISHSLYYDDRRWNAFYPIHSKICSGVFTNKKKAEEYNNMIDKLKPLIPDNTPLVTNKSHIRGLMNTAPYGLSGAWIPKGQIPFLLSNAYKEQKRYPWVLDSENDFDMVKHCLGLTNDDYICIAEYQGMKLYKPKED